MRFLFLFLSAIISTLLFSCDPCNNLDCDEYVASGNFRIVSAATSQDLVFGPNKIYDKNQIRFYSIKGTDTTFFRNQPVRSSGAGYDSSLRVIFYPNPDIAYMRLGNGDIDTLNFSYRTSETRCCGTQKVITNIRYNNAVDTPADKGVQELRK